MLGVCQKRVLDPLELDLWVVVNQYVDPGVEPGFSVRATNKCSYLLSHLSTLSPFFEIGSLDILELTEIHLPLPSTLLGLKISALYSSYERLVLY